MGVPRGTSAAEKELVEHLRRLRAKAGLTVAQVHFRMPELIGGKKKPGLSTLHRRLGGSHLRNDVSLVRAVIGVCVTDSKEAQAAWSTAEELLQKSWKRPVHSGPGRDDEAVAADDCRAHLLKLVAVQDRLLEANAALDAALQGRLEAEAALTLRLGPVETELAAFERQLLVVTGERDAALQATQEAQRRISSLESLLAAAQRAAPTGRTERRPADVSQTGPSADEDTEIVSVQQELVRLDPRGQRMTAVVAQAMGRLLDGEHTGRYRWESLSKFEKATLGQVVENLLRHEFQFEHGNGLDLTVAGTEVDVKVSTGQSWMIPPELVGALCLLVGLDTRRNLWSLGLVRATPETLAGASNRDGKRMLSGSGRRAITWIHRDIPFPGSVLATLSEEEAEAVLSDPRGQLRVESLFRAVQRRLVPRSDIDAVTRQANGPRRIREARERLAADGIVVFGEWPDDAEAARGLGLPVPGRETWVSARLAPAEDESTARSVLLGASRWRLALPSDPPVAIPRLR
ncbi:NaeI family type II restriction endonuclease [Kitasatospora sp. A2-31]|uniref:NaeI family type II restriction endonuclease n=1 Tax=Kitasatospora sp. A2-31 TaxID=2916414 RepID=UPI001EECEAC0|nr:NaeI family type II restriction endonuclease [Kitasatospora sp. A2-31]MCG6495707.1 hypothetical protein [Kitasatospora sp. A2-31]